MQKKHKKRGFFRLSKRRKFVLISILLSFGLLGVQYFDDLYRYIAIFSLSIITFFLVIWSLSQDLKKVGYFIAPILPTLFTVSIGLFYFLLPEQILTRIILFVLFGVGMYAILLTENILTVSAIRTIQLLRAAHALSFLFSLLVSFLIYDTVFSFKFSPWINMILVLISSIPIYLQAIWSTTLQDELNKEVVLYSLSLSWLTCLSAFFISFWPVSIVIASLFLVTVLYVGLGIIQQAMLGRLFSQTIKEYLRVGILVLIVVFFAAKWG